MSLNDLAIILGGATAAGLGVTAVVSRRPPWQIDDRAAGRLAWLLVLLWAAVVGALAVLRHRAFNSHAYDLAIFDQVIWNSAHGRLFENSVMADSPSFLGHHFSPLLLALVPVYGIYPDPSALVAAQALLIALAGLPLFWLARDRLRSPGLALAVLLAYLLQPATAYVALFDFHEIALAIPLLAGALYFMLARRYPPFALCLALAFLAKEEIGIVAAAMGGFIALAQHRWRLGLGIAVAGLLWTLLMVRFVIPGFHAGGEYFFGGRFANLGPTPLGVVRTVLLDPALALGELFAPTKLIYLQRLFAPLALLPLLGWPVLAIALPTFLYLLLSDQVSDNYIEFQYSATLLPFLLGATVVGLSRLHERAKPHWPRLAPAMAAFVVVAAALGAYLYGPLPFARHFTPESYQTGPRIAAARELIAAIPPDASVIAQSALVPQLSRRRTIQLFGLGDGVLRPDYYLFDTDSRASRYPFSYEDKPYFEAVARVTADAEYRTVAARDGYLLVQRETPDIGTRVAVTFGDQLTLAGYRFASGQVRPGDTLTVTLFWRAERPPEADFTAFMHLLDRAGNRWGQHDTYPTGTALPTSRWGVGQLLRGEYAIPLAPEAPAGEYRLLVGLYNVETMQRLPATGGAPEPGADAIALGPLGVPKPYSLFPVP